jgi:hypothetical protein
MNEHANQDCCEAGRPMVATEPPRETNKAREIKILQQDLGFIVAVGCQTFAIETKEKLIRNLTAYLENPNEVERKWMRNKELL